MLKLINYCGQKSGAEASLVIICNGGRWSDKIGRRMTGYCKPYAVSAGQVKRLRIRRAAETHYSNSRQTWPDIRGDILDRCNIVVRFFEVWLAGIHHTQDLCACSSAWAPCVTLLDY